MEALGFDNIFGEQEIENLFTNEETPAEASAEETSGDTTPEEKENEETTEVDPESLFGGEEKPESVGSGNTEGKEKGEPTTDTGEDTSPNIDFYSSIANAMAVDGIFPNLDEETIKKVKSAEEFSNLIEAEVNARLDDAQQRIAKALANGVEPSDIQKFENSLNYLSRITEQQLNDETEKGEQLRFNLIYQDFLNKGMEPEKARKFAKRSVDAGTDVEDAKEALQGNKDFFQKKYNELQENAQMEAEKYEEERKAQAEKLKSSILKDKDLIGDMEISAEIRKKAFDNISRPIYKDTESGEYLTALQKYEQEHRTDFLKYVSLFYTLTNGFKDFDTIGKIKAKKEIKKGLSELEKAFNATKRNSDGSLRMMTSAKEDPESYFGKGMKLDI